MDMALALRGFHEELGRMQGCPEAAFGLQGKVETGGSHGVRN